MNKRKSKAERIVTGHQPREQRYNTLRDSAFRWWQSRCPPRAIFELSYLSHSDFRARVLPGIPNGSWPVAENGLKGPIKRRNAHDHGPPRDPKSMSDSQELLHLHAGAAKVFLCLWGSTSGWPIYGCPASFDLEGHCQICIRVSGVHLTSRACAGMTKH